MTTAQTEKSEHAAVLTTSLQRLKDADACANRYGHLLKALGKTKADDEPLNLLTIIEKNGIADAIWALVTTTQNCDTIARLFAADCAEAVLYLFERDRPDDKRPRMAIESARSLDRPSPTTEEQEGLWEAAWNAYFPDVGEAAWAAAWAQAAGVGDAPAAAWRAAEAAFRAAAWVGADVLEEQKRMLIRYLLPGEPA